MDFTLLKEILKEEYTSTKGQYVYVNPHVIGFTCNATISSVQVCTGELVFIKVI